MQHDSRGEARQWPRWMRGMLSSLGMFVAVLGKLLRPLLRQYRTADRYDRGLILMLPGVESESLLDVSVVWGLADGGWAGAMEIEDWTTGNPLLFLYHLRGWRRNLKQAQRIADRIVEYQDEFPGRPVHLVGHSGGAAVSILVLEALPLGRKVTSVIMLAPALSPGYPLQTALGRVERGVWNFHSFLDVFFLGSATLLLGTVDGRFDFSAGLLGFRRPANLSPEEAQLYQERLHHQRYDFRMLRTFSLGGHFGCTNRAFVEVWVAPLVRS